MNILLAILSIVYVLGYGGFFLHVMTDDSHQCTGIARLLGAIITAIIWPFIIVAGLFKGMFSK